MASPLDLPSTSDGRLWYTRYGTRRIHENRAWQGKQYSCSTRSFIACEDQLVSTVGVHEQCANHLDGPLHPQTGCRYPLPILCHLQVSADWQLH